MLVVVILGTPSFGMSVEPEMKSPPGATKPSRAPVAREARRFRMTTVS